MSAPKFLQKSVLDLQIQFTSSAIQTPIILNEGTGISNVMEVDVPDNIEYEMTATGDVSVALLPIAVSGKLTLHPQSPALQQLANVNIGYGQNTQIIPGVITVSSNSAGINYKFDNVAISKPFGGLTANKVLEDYVFNFKATIPDLTSLMQLVNTSAGVVNVA